MRFFRTSHSLSSVLRAVAIVAVAVLTLTWAAPAQAQNAQDPGQVTFTETFTDGVNTGEWTFGNAFDRIVATGGNPGAYLRNDFIDSFAPRPRTSFGVESIFTGNYREAGVTFLGIDLRLFSVDFTAEGRPLSLILINDNGTPDDFLDDCQVAFIGNRNIPLERQPWLKYNFRVPSDSLTLPQGWSVLGSCGTDDATWNQVVTDVDQVRYFFGDPNLFFIFQVWDVGLDNPSITFGR